MDKLIFLLILVVVKMTFMLIPYDGITYSFFPLSEQELTFHTYVYFAMEHIGCVLFSYMIYSESEKYQVGLFTFFALMLADFVDYLLCYNCVWFKIGEFPVTMNIAFCFIFGIAVVYEAYND